ncbi:MAG: GH36-type glycosyl hydrolase domain-containing protein [Steroidobacteraceae bacterium]
MSAPAKIVTSRAGLRAELTASGAVRRFDCGPTTLTLFVGSEVECGPANLFLRRPAGKPGWTPLLGPSSPTRFGTPAGNRLAGRGIWQGIEYDITLALAEEAPVWFWHVRLRNASSEALELDLTYAQDVALAPYGAVRMNEYYVSQYVDHTPLCDPERGTLIASRQNQAADGRNPWCLIGSLRRVISFATDALDFYGLSSRAGEPPAGILGDLPGRRLQHEHSMAVLRDAPLRLAPGESLHAGFFGTFVANHPGATSDSDLARVSAIMALPEATPGAEPAAAEPAATESMDPPLTAASDGTLFSAATPLTTASLDEGALRQLFPPPWRHEETDEQGGRLAFFHGAGSHVVLRAKELRVLRPHGQLLRTGRHLTPDESALVSTVWMTGVFHSMLAQGHVSINRFLSTNRSYLGFYRSQGLRVFAKLGGEWRLLGIPSAFEMTPASGRWIYRHGGGEIQVRSAARSGPHALTLDIEVTAGPDTAFLICQHIALNGDDGNAAQPLNWRRAGDTLIVTPAPDSDVGRRFPRGEFRIALAPQTAVRRVGADELLFLDGRSRQEPYLCIETSPARSAALTISGHLVAEESQTPWRLPSAEALAPSLTLEPATSGQPGERAKHLAEMVPWYAQNALVHYLSPRGLEQYSGGGWGTRDVCQGPVEMLLAMGRTEPLRDVVLRVMANQNPDGDWPQWFMFFERERGIRAGDSHGDIVFWPLVALADYLIASGDADILEARVPFFDSKGPDAGERATVWQHLERAFGLIDRRRIPGTTLAAYGHGDWNDSLQPADPALRDHMCSAWTVTLHFQALTTLAQALRSLGREAQAEPLERQAEAVRVDFQRLLIPDGVLTGYAVFDGDADIRYLLHPRDTTTGVRYSSLAMIHAILEDMLAPDQTRAHLEIIERELTGPDGVRLFDRPMPYHGGPQRIFQRAESATFFGREIGLMYMHAHLRYAQALAHVGLAEKFFLALCQADPIGVRSVVPTATLRQANCYYSSSDAAFADRYQAREEYARIREGTIPLDGGWRVYSSGAGIAFALTLRRFLGLSWESGALSIDPVMPGVLDRMRVMMSVRGRPLEVTYRVGAAGCGVNEVALNGERLPFTREANPHRRGAVRVPAGAVLDHLTGSRNTLTIDLG